MPDGKRLVVEHVSVEAHLVGADKLILLNLRPVPASGDNRILAVIPPVFGGVAVATFYTGSQPMRVYLDDDFVMCGFKQESTSPSFFSAMVWGYLVDRP